MNLKLITIDRLREFLNKFSKVAISGKYSDLSGIPTKVSQFTNDIGYAKVTDIPTVTTYTAGEGIDITNGVISIIVRKKVGGPTCPGYTLYGNYFLSNTITPKNWNEARDMNIEVAVSQNYNYGGVETKTTTARTLSKSELESLTLEQRNIYDRGRSWYWTSTLYDDSRAWVVGSGVFGYSSINDGYEYGGARLGFLNPFI